MKTHRAFYFQIAGVLSTVALVVLLSHFFPLVVLVAKMQQRVAQWGAWSAICYPFFFALCNLLLLPGGILCVGSGFLYGLWWGFALVFFGNAVGAAIAFSLSRWVGRDWFRQRALRNRIFNVLEPAVARDGWKVILLSQLHPFFPTSLINYLYGLTTVRFRTFMIWVSVGRAPGLFLYTYLGTLGQQGVNLALGKTHPRAMEYWIWGGAFLVTALLFFVLSNIAVRALRKAEVSSEPRAYPTVSAPLGPLTTR